MCGILGTVNVPFGKEVLDTISHRGPDDEGTQAFEIGVNAKVYFAHRRLSIVDLSAAGHQPMSSKCGRFAIVFNGEIYNHIELRKKLTNIAFTGHSDTETIVNYLAEFGIEKVIDFNGIFAFALLDKKKGLLYLVRDRYGVKPLYYSEEANKLFFSSELKPILKLKNSTELCTDQLRTFLQLRYNPSPETLFKNINKLTPGHYLVVNIHDFTSKIFSFLKPVQKQKITFEEALNGYEEKFENAIKRQLMSDVPIGMLLSGGLDSAMVCYYAQKHLDKQIQTFTVGFDDSTHYTDEISDANSSARILNTKHTEIKISETDFDSVFSKCVNIIEEPLGTTSVIPMFYLNQEVSKHVKVALTGQGADEPLGGYTKYQGEWWHQRLPHTLLTLAKPLSNFHFPAKYRRALNSLSERDAVKRFNNIYTVFDNKEIIQMTGGIANTVPPIEYMYNLMGGKNLNSLDAIMAIDLHLSLADDLLLYTDKISMNFSFEARVPILDNDLVDYILSLPVAYRIKRNNGKYIHKKLAEKILPKEIVNRPKKGFQSPTDNWFKGTMSSKYKSLLTDSSSVFSNYINKESVLQIFKEHQTSTKNREKELFMLVSFYYWCQYFLR